jgi:prolyl 4-hydroxylase
VAGVPAEVEEGGETTLPLADAIDAEAQTLDHPSQCAQRMGIAVRPRKGECLLRSLTCAVTWCMSATSCLLSPRWLNCAHMHPVCLQILLVCHGTSVAGDALLFFDMDISGSKGDRKALHASCPTLKVHSDTTMCCAADSLS